MTVFRRQVAEPVQVRLADGVRSGPAAIAQQHLDQQSLGRPLDGLVNPLVEHLRGRLKVATRLPSLLRVRW